MPDTGVKTAASAEVHLKRAYDFLNQLDDAAEEFRKHVVAFSAQMDDSQNQPFLQSVAAGFGGTRRLKQQKAALLQDLQLAEQEINLAVASNPDAVLPPPSDPLTATHLRAMVIYGRGQLEMMLGSTKEARRLLNDSLAIFEIPDTHYMLGMIHEADYQPAEALAHFERYLALDPNGEWSVPAVREADAMRRYKKRFRGSWLLFVILLFFYVVPGVIYFIVKRK